MCLVAAAITGVVMYNNTKLRPPPSSSLSPSSSSETQLQLLPSPGGPVATSVLDRKSPARSLTPKFKSAAP